MMYTKFIMNPRSVNSDEYASYMRKWTIIGVYTYYMYIWQSMSATWKQCKPSCKMKHRHETNLGEAASQISSSKLEKVQRTKNNKSGSTKCWCTTIKSLKTERANLVACSSVCPQVFHAVFKSRVQNKDSCISVITSLWQIELQPYILVFTIWMSSLVPFLKLHTIRRFNSDVLFTNISPVSAQYCAPWLLLKRKQWSIISHE